MIAFVDTNILLYTVSADERKVRAAEVLREGGVISAQVLNEFTHIARRKLRHDWVHIELAIAQFHDVFDVILPLTSKTHAAGLALARDHGFSIYDALIVASALEAGCSTLWSEDMQHGRSVDGLVIVNPFSATEVPLRPARR